MITYLFPTPVYATNLNLLTPSHADYVSKAMELHQSIDQKTKWRCDTFNTLDAYDMLSDPLFFNLFEEIKTHTKIFCKDFGVEANDVTITDSWINVAGQGGYQEYHIHTGSHFSLAYYVSAPKNSGNIVFRSHEADTDMYPLPQGDLKPSSYKTYSIEPQEGMLLIFRSNLRHMVEKNLSDNNRISISMNLNVK